MGRVASVLIAVSCLCFSDQPAKEAAPIAVARPAEPTIKEVQAQLSQSELLVAALQRRLKATDDERIDAQTRLVLMRDEIARLNDELETVRKGN